MVYLDTTPSVVNWTYEPFPIPYVSNKRSGKLRRYYPDFFVETSDERVIIEIKPYKKLTHVSVVKKTDACKAWCAANEIKFRFITEVELKALKILRS